jgi:methionine-rich copper-binding protein CopC
MAIIQIGGCANIVPPSGGPRDSIPPYAVYAKPKDSSTNIAPKEILISFNEYITTNAIQEQLIVSPNIKNNPLVDQRLNMVRIRLSDSLNANTTYSLQFGNALRDVNEGNIAQNFTYVFSTGDYIDTGKLYGKVQIAETGLVDSSLIAVLHPIDNDSAIFKDKPAYYTRINGQGIFEFNFLPSKDFNIYILPNDYNKRYDDSTKLFAFLNNTVHPTKTNDSIQLYAFEASPKKEKKSASNSSVKNAKKQAPVLKYSSNLEGNEKDILSSLTLNFETPIRLNDSFKIGITDTNLIKLETAQVMVNKQNKQQVEIEFPWEANTDYKLVLPQKSIQDSLSNFLVKADTIRFKTKPESSYGTAIIRVNGFQQFEQPVLLLIQDQKVKFSYPITQNVLRIPLLPPGDYQLKLLMDVNQNGRWDTGKFMGKKRQPELVRNLNLNLNIRVNWDNEMNLILKP